MKSGKIDCRLEDDELQNTFLKYDSSNRPMFGL